MTLKQKQKRRAGPPKEPPAEKPNSWREQLVARWPFVLVVVAVVAHSPALGSGFVWDDDQFLAVWLPAFESPFALFFPPEGIPEWPYSYYRPAGVLSLKLDETLYGDAPLGWHITNLIIHAAVSVQVFYLIANLLRAPAYGRLTAVFASTLFAVHPIHVESVNWIAGRSDPLATLFVLAAVWLCCGLESRIDVWRAAGAGACLFLGLLCKEVAIAALPLGAAAVWAIRWQRTNQPGSEPGVELPPLRRVTIAIGASMLLATAAYFVLRFSATPPPSSSGQSIDLLATVGGVTRAFGFYFGQMFLVQRQVVYPPASFTPPPALVAVGLIAGVAGGVWLWRWQWTAALPLAIGAVWFAAAIAPSLLVIVGGLDKNGLSERYLYLPSIGACLVIGFAFDRMRGRLGDGAVAAAVAVLCLFLTWRAIDYGRYWTDDAALWTRNVAYVPKLARAWVNLSLDSKREGRLEDALQYARRAVEAEPDNAKWLINLAITARESKQHEEARDAARQAIQANDAAFTAWLELGLAELALGNREASESHFRKTLELDPRSAQAHVNLAYLHSDKPEIAIGHLKSALEFDPGNAMAYNNLGKQHAQQKRYDAAIRCFQRALQLDPKLDVAAQNLAVVKQWRESGRGN